MKLFIKLMVLLFLVLSFTSHAQTITIKKLLDLQQSNQITMQDYLETSSWKLYKIVTLKEADSILFHSSVFPKLTNNYKAEPLLSKIDSNVAAWIEYDSKIDVEINGALYITSVTIIQPEYLILCAKDRNKKNIAQHKFNQSVKFSYFGDSIHTEVLKEIATLQIPIISSKIETTKNKIKRIYTFKSQVMELTTYKSTSNSANMYEVKISSKSDFEYLNSF